MNNIENISKEIKNIFFKKKEIISLYVYGSILFAKFNPRKSDVDLLLIVKDSEDPAAFIKEIKNLSGKIKKFKPDINIVFLSEFKKRWHIYRPPSYFIGIKYSHRIIFGKNLIKSVNDSELSKHKIYKRVVDLTQGSRGIYLNDKNPIFWRKKYIRWLRIAVLEVLFLTGEFDLSFDSGLRKLKKKYKKLSFLDKLKKDSLEMEEINEVAESLKMFIFNNFIMK
ncbi:nucleotidyltransferase domain-containing protein [bacterium]|nr:nucleotidyltransferase domain-containing protein [bacterium]